MPGEPVAKLAASREKSSRCERSMFVVCGSFLRRSVRCGWYHEPTPKIGGSWNVSGVSGGAFPGAGARGGFPGAPPKGGGRRDPLGGGGGGVHVGGAAPPGGPPPAGAAGATAAGQGDVRVEPQEAGALRVARVLHRLRVPVEVPT